MALPRCVRFAGFMPTALAHHAAGAQLFPDEAQEVRIWGGGGREGERRTPEPFFLKLLVLLHRMGDSSELKINLIKMHPCTAQTHNSGYLVKAADGHSNHSLL